MGAPADEPREGDGAERASADLLETLRQIGDSGRAGIGAAGDTAKALRSLVSADLSLARSALGRSVAFTGVAVVFGGSAWLLLMAGFIVFLSRPLGLPWTVSLLITAAVSIAIAAFGGWRAMHYFEHTRLQATRRQLARLGIGELADFMPGAGDAASARDAAGVPPQDANGQPAKDRRGVDVTPP